MAAPLNMTVVDGPGIAAALNCAAAAAAAWSNDGLVCSHTHNSKLLHYSQPEAASLPPPTE